MVRYSIFLIALLIFLVYICGIYKVPKDFTIIQTSLINLKDDLILEKNPIVISDAIVDCTQVTQTVFTYLYVYQTKNPIIKKTNQYNYLLIRSKDYSEILIQHPKSNLQSLIKLHLGNVLILPWGWKYLIIKKNVQIIGLHTLSSLIATSIFPLYS